MAGVLQEKKRNVTLADIAREVGVSQALVGKVLGSCSGNIRVSKKTAAIIEETAKRLNYRPNLSARILSGQKSKLLGVLIDTQPPPARFRTLAYIDKYAVAKGYRILIGEAHDSIDSLYQHYQNFMQYNADGVICLAHDYPDQAERLRELFQSVNNIVFIEKPALDNTIWVDVDREQATFELTTLLLEQRKRVGLIAENPAYYTIQQRLAGYKRAFQEHGVKPNPSLIHMIQNKEKSLEERMLRIAEEFVLPARLDAVIAPNDLSAAYLMRALLKHNIRIPEKIAVAGFDNEPFAESLYPSLTSIDDNNEQIGKAAVQLLLERLGTAPASSPKSIRIIPRVIRREST